MQIDSDRDAVDSSESVDFSITELSGLIIPIYENPDNRVRENDGILTYILTRRPRLATESRYAAMPSSLLEFELQALDVIDQP